MQLNSTSDEKISKLLSTLEDLLDEDGVGEIEAVIGKTAFSRAIELRHTLRKQEHPEPKISKLGVETSSQASDL